MLPLAHRRAALTAALLLAAAPALRAQMTPDQQAAQVLDGGRRAFNDKNYPAAAARFREFLQRFGGHKDAPSARYGLALCLLEGPERDYAAALNELNPLTGLKDFPEQPRVLYYRGLAARGLATKALAQAAAKPNEAPQHRQQAQARFDEAGKYFAEALAAFAERAKTVPADVKELPADVEWAARARCDLAEMQLRTGKAKEARDTAAPFVDDKLLARSRYRALGVYCHGYACFLLNDLPAAARSLGLLAPFADPAFGTHAAYLRARVHHLEGERPEARRGYEAVLAGYAAQKAAAAEALKQPDRFKNDPEEKARLEELVKGSPPEHVARAGFFLGVLLYEDGKFAEAQKALADFRQHYPNTPLAADAQLREGFCLVQLKQFAEAQKALQPLADKDPRLADQALLWLGKGQVAAADPANAPAYEAALKAAMDTFRKAAERAQQAAAADPEAKPRRGEILFELAEAQQLAKQYKDAVATYTQIANEKLLPQRDEELLLGQATALHLMGDYAASDQVCQRFQQTYPKSTLLPAVLFRFAENAGFSLAAAEKLPNPADRARETPKWTDEAVKRYQEVVAKYPEFAQANVARYGLGLALYRKGELDKAKERLEAVPASDRTGELAAVPYYLADILIRTAPAKADDAVTAGRLEEQLKQASEHLEAFAGAQQSAPQTPDALVKLGYCQQRLAGLFAQPPDKQKALAAARAAYEQVLQKFPKDPAAPYAHFERAKVLAQAGDPNAAMNELRRFANDPLKAAPVAPLGLLHLATLLRAQNKPAEAADVLKQCREQHEAALKADPARAAWVPLLQYHQGVALREAGKRAEARAVFELVMAQSPDRPEAADAALRSGQALKDDGEAKLGEAAKRLANPGLKPEEVAAAKKLQDEGAADLKNASAFFLAKAEQLKAKQPQSEARARMLYEAAWASRALGELETQAAREKARQDLWQKRREEVAKKTPPGQQPPPAPEPELPAATAVPVQPAEAQARAQYQALIAAFPDVAANADARFELAELMAERGEFDPAVKLLREALDKEPGPELADKVRVRLGACLLAKGDTKAALAQLEPVAANAKSLQAAQATYRVGECFMQRGEYAEAVKHLARLRDHGPFQNLPGVTDRALLRLGHALAHLKQWDASRQAHEQVVSRFGSGPWAVEARYGVGWVWQNQGRYDEAVNAYNQVVAATASELGARAQLNIGLCRLAQKKHGEAAAALMIVPYTYDYPQINALALVEAARALAEAKQEEQAARLLERVLRDHPGTEQAEAARKRLEELRKG
jgi:TolA-binding protein